MSRANDPSLHSWIQIAPDCDFQIQNLPYGIFQTPTRDPRVGVAIGEYVLDVYVLTQHGLFDMLDVEDPTVFHRPYLNDFMALGRPIWRQVRNRLSELLRNDNPEIRDNDSLMRECLLQRKDVELLLPVQICNFTDFYSSQEHATHVGQLFRDPENPLHPNWKHMPVGYHSRSSSIVPSGVPIRRPKGQMRLKGSEMPVFGPTRQLDFELETAFMVGQPTELGTSLTTLEAEEYIFGVVLLNDWSARDIQAWESAPLGPFLSKNFATSISPWVVPLDALEPFRVPGPPQGSVLPYLEFSGDKHLDLHLEVSLQTPTLPQEVLLTRTNARHLYWNMNQQLTHHTLSGCNLQIGDLYASGTISGPTPGSYGCLLELTWKGSQPLQLPDGSSRTYLHDGDTVTLRGYAHKNGVRVGFGEVRTQILPAI